MAFLADEKRSLNLSTMDKDINTSPGMYNSIKAPKKTSFNTKCVPFGSSADRPLLKHDYRSFMQQTQSLPLVQLERPASKLRSARRLMFAAMRGTAPKKKKIHPNRILGMKSRSVDYGPPPGYYYKDPVQERIKKIAKQKKARREARRILRKNNRRLSKLMKGQAERSPSIPSKELKFGYHPEKSKSKIQN